MSPNEHFTYTEKRGFFQRFGLAIGLLGLAMVGLFVGRQMFSGHEAAPRRMEMVTITPLPTPPPPPPPPPPPTPTTVPKQEMMEQTPTDTQEAKPEAAPDPAPAIGTNITGNGPADGFGLGRNTGGNFVGGGAGGRSGGSRFGWYANQVKRVVTEALQAHPRTRVANFSIKVRVWPDATGRITRAKLASSTGDPALDAAIAQEVLPGLQLQEPPPPGMPTPIVMRFDVRRPN